MAGGGRGRRTVTSCVAVTLTAASFVALAVPVAAAAPFKGVTGVANLPLALSLGADAVRTYDQPQLDAAAAACASSPQLRIFAGIPLAMSDSPAAAAAFVAHNAGTSCIAWWIAGNELDTAGGGDGSAGVALAAAAAAAAKAADAASRPATTCLAGLDRLPAFLAASSAFDALCLNAYAAAEGACASVAAAGFHGPFILGEFSHAGWWEVPAGGPTGVFLEPSSSSKAASAAAAYAGGVTACPALGVTPVASFAFTVERKVEGSATYFGLLGASPAIAGGAPAPVADRWEVLRALWAGATPARSDVPALLANAGLPVVDGDVRVANGGVVAVSAPVAAALAVLPGAPDGWACGWDIVTELVPPAGPYPPDAAPAVTWAAPAPPGPQGGLRGAAPGYDADAAGLRAPATPGAYRVTAWLARADGAGPGVVTASAPILVQ